MIVHCSDCFVQFLFQTTLTEVQFGPMKLYEDQLQVGLMSSILSAFKT